MKGSMETTFDDLPRELVTDILGRVASASFTDLRSAKRCCKKFLEAAKEDFIYRQVSLEQFPVIPWHDNDNKISNFLDKCRRSKNPEALFRKAVVDYFGGKNSNDAFECLKEVAKSGHEDASYTMAIILLFMEGELKQRGIKLLSKKSRIKKRKFNDSRQRLISMLRTLWIRNATILKQPRPIFCTAHKKKGGWDVYKNQPEEDNDCDGCFCDEEVAPIYDILPDNIY